MGARAKPGGTRGRGGRMIGAVLVLALVLAAGATPDRAVSVGLETGPFAAATAGR